MKLKEFDFNTVCAKGLSIFLGDKEVAAGFKGEVLRQVQHLAEYEINQTNYYLDDMLVIRLKDNQSRMKSDEAVGILRKILTRSKWVLSIVNNSIDTTEIEKEISAMTESIRCMELFPELIEALDDRDYTGDYMELIKKAKGEMG